MIRKIFKKDLTIALNVLYFEKNIYIHPAYVLKHNSDRKTQVILLMILEKICIIKKNNVRTPQRFLLIELPSFFRNKKQT